jgi:hypothetical protein
MAVSDENRRALATKSPATPKVGPTTNNEQEIAKDRLGTVKTTGMPATRGVISCALEEGG